MANKPSFPGVPPVSAGLSLTSADNGVWRELYLSPSSGNGTMAGRIRALSDGTADAGLLAARKIGGVHYPVGYLAVAAGAGVSGSVPWTDVLDCLNTGQSMALAPDEALCVKLETSLGAGKTIWLHLEGAPL